MHKHHFTSALVFQEPGEKTLKETDSKENPFAEALCTSGS